MLRYRKKAKEEAENLKHILLQPDESMLDVKQTCFTLCYSILM